MSELTRDEDDLVCGCLDGLDCRVRRWWRRAGWAVLGVFVAAVVWAALR